MVSIFRRDQKSSFMMMIIILFVSHHSFQASRSSWVVSDFFFNVEKKATQNQIHSYHHRSNKNPTYQQC